MSTIKTIELTGAALDWAVAKCEFQDGRIKVWVFPSPPKRPEILVYHEAGNPDAGGVWFNPSEAWSLAGPIIEREKIGPRWSPLWKKWECTDPRNAALGLLGDTFLEAAMRCHVLAWLGESVDVPATILELPA